MGRRLLPLMMTLLLLTGCAGEPEADSGEALALRIRDDFADMTACSCRADLTADYGTRVFTCTLDAVWDAALGARLTVVEPQLLAGVTARVSADGVTLTYDTVSLETGPLTDDGLSLFEALPTLLGQVTGGCIAAWDLTDTALTVTYRDGVSDPGTGLEATVTFDRSDRTPTGGELYWNGTRVISAQLRDFQMMMGET